MQFVSHESSVRSASLVVSPGLIEAFEWLARHDHFLYPFHRVHSIVSRYNGAERPSVLGRQGNAMHSSGQYRRRLKRLGQGDTASKSVDTDAPRLAIGSAISSNQHHLLRTRLQAGFLK